MLRLIWNYGSIQAECRHKYLDMDSLWSIHFFLECEFSFFRSSWLNIVYLSSSFSSFFVLIIFHRSFVRYACITSHVLMMFMELINHYVFYLLNTMLYVFGIKITYIKMYFLELVCLNSNLVLLNESSFTFIHNYCFTEGSPFKR